MLKHESGHVVHVLMLGDWGPGGILNHTKCLLKELRVCEGVEIYCIGEDEPYAGGKYQGHDIRKLFQLRRVIKRFKPDVVHVQKFCLVNFFYLKFFTRIPRIVSLHMPYGGLLGFKGRVLKWLMSPCYYLPVSGATWRSFLSIFPGSRGEVFFNPIQVTGVASLRDGKAGLWKNGDVAVLGMMGRNAVVKDWPVLGRIAKRLPRVAAWGIGVTAAEAESFGEGAECVQWKGRQQNGREWIRRFDLFVLTSTHEEMPTVVLECFAERTPICGFIPRGGMEEILAFSNGALKEVFMQDRDVDGLAQVVDRILQDADLRRRLIEDGWQIVTQHFAAEKIVPEQLVPIYRKVCGHA